MKGTIFLSALFAFTTSVHGSFSVPNLKLPTKGGMTSGQLDNSLYLFGGENDTAQFSNELYKLTLADNTFNWEALPQTNAPNGNVAGQGYIKSDNQSFVVMGGVTAANTDFEIHTYNLASHTWTANTITADPNTLIFSNRKSFSATYDPSTQQTYVYGGYDLGSSNFTNDFVVFDENFKMTTLTPPGSAHYGHTASLTSSGKIVVLGGVVSTTQLADMHTAFVYTIATKIWSTVDLTAASGNAYPNPRAGHIAVVNSDDQIVIFGGDTDGILTSKVLFNDVAILDTKTWAWNTPASSGTPPDKRSYASGGILDGKTLTVGFGELSDAYNDINVYDFSTNSWIEQFSGPSQTSSQTSSPTSSSTSSPKPSPDSSSGVSKGLIAGVTVAGVAVLSIIAFLLWKFRFCSRDRTWGLKDRPV